MTATREPIASPAPLRASDSLLPVLRVIPEQCYERSNSRAWALVAQAVAVWGVLLTALVFADAWYFVLPLSIATGLAVASLFILGHDAAHGALFESKRLNRSVGRALFVPSLHIFELWVLGHNRIHHGHTLREGMDFVWHPATVADYLAMNRFARARHRIEWSAFGSGFYYLRSVWWQKMHRFPAPQRYAVATRKDKQFLFTITAIALVVTAGLSNVASLGVLGTVWMIVKLFVLPFVVFSWTIGFAVYVHHIAPDIKWWPRRAWNSFHGQVEGTTILKMPKIIDKLVFHNIFIHVPHHVDTRIPCYKLVQAADAIVAAFPEATGRKYRFADFRKSTRVCKLYDFEKQTWLPYP